MSPITVMKITAHNN